MKKFLVLLITVVLVVNLAACNKLSSNSTTNMDSEVPLSYTLDEEPFVSPFIDQYSDPHTNLEFKMHSCDMQNEYCNYNTYKYSAQHITYSGPYKSTVFSSDTAYYLKQDTFSEDYYNIFEYTFDKPFVNSAYFDFADWIKYNIDLDSHFCNYKLYKFVLDSSVPSIQLEKKHLKNQSIEEESSETIETTEPSNKPTMEYTDEQLERYDKYREQSDAEFIEDYLTNDLDHYEEDLNTVLDAIDIAIQEAENEKEALLAARTKGEKIADSDNIGYLLTYEFKDQDEDDKEAGETLYKLIYGYDSNLDSFYVSIDGRHYAKKYNHETAKYENTAYDFESYLAAMLSNFVKVTGDEPQEEGIEKTLTVYENKKLGTSIKIYDQDTYTLTYKPRFNFFEKTGYGIFDDTYKEKHFIYEHLYLNEDEIELIIKNHPYKEYYATFYTDNNIPYIMIASKPLLELKPGDPIIRYDIDRNTQASTELLEQIINELDSMDIVYTYTDQYHNQQLPDHNADMNVHTGMFKESDVKDYYTYDLYNDVGIQVTVPEFYNTSEFNTSEDICNVVEDLDRTTELGTSNVSITFSRFVKDNQDIESSKEYSEIVEEFDINGKHCLLIGTEYSDSCRYTAFIEAKPSQYVSIETICLEGSYYYNQETYKESIKQLLSLVKVK